VLQGASSLRRRRAGGPAVVGFGDVEDPVQSGESEYLFDGGGNTDQQGPGRLLKSAVEAEDLRHKRNIYALRRAEVEDHGASGLGGKFFQVLAKRGSVPWSSEDFLRQRGDGHGSFVSDF